MEELAARVRSAVIRVTEANTHDHQKPPRIGMVVDMSESNMMSGFIPSLVEKKPYPYSRPEFLFFSEDEIKLSADQTIRPIVCPKYPRKIPLLAGYAELINGGKTKQNEDQAVAKMLSLCQLGCEAEEARTLEQSQEERERDRSDDCLLSPAVTSPRYSHSPRADAALFAILDGHAGPATAVLASDCLHEHVKFQLCRILETLINRDRYEWFSSTERRDSQEELPTISADQLVIGALETAFMDMDDQIAKEKQVWRLPGGCAAIAVLVILGKLYIANAGDCRAVLSTSGAVRAVSRDHTPSTERKRLQTLAFNSPELLGAYYSRLEYSRHLTKRDLKRRVFYRDWCMDGWASKTVKEEDLRPPMINEYFKKKRLLNTIGVSRGFGDQQLMTVEEHLLLKPFLSPVPEVEVVDLRKLDSIGDMDILIVASDGLWDALSNEEAVAIVETSLRSTDQEDEARYIMAAQELLIAARGQMVNGRWSQVDGPPASTDDITAFVIPLKNCVAPPAPFERGVEDDDDGLLCVSAE